MNLCSKPRCTRLGSVALAYDYGRRTAILQDHPEGELSPHLYALCLGCAERLSPPRGWTLEDERSVPALFATASHGHLSVVTVDEPEPEEAAVSKRQLFFGSSI